MKDFSLKLTLLRNRILNEFRGVEYDDVTRHLIRGVILEIFPKAQYFSSNYAKLRVGFAIDNYFCIVNLCSSNEGFLVMEKETNE